MKDWFEMYWVGIRPANLQPPVGETIKFVLYNVW